MPICCTAFPQIANVYVHCPVQSVQPGSTSPVVVMLLLWMELRSHATPAAVVQMHWPSTVSQVPTTARSCAAMASSPSPRAPARCCRIAPALLRVSSTPPSTAEVGDFRLLLKLAHHRSIKRRLLLKCTLAGVLIFAAPRLSRSKKFRRLVETIVGGATSWACRLGRAVRQLGRPCLREAA